MAAKFEFVSTYADSGLPLPERKTADSAGYDFVVAEDTIVPSWDTLSSKLFDKYLANHQGDMRKEFLSKISEDASQKELEKISNEIVAKYAQMSITLEEMADLTKTTGAKPTLVPTGVKCRLDPGTYLELSVRSSCPLKYWLILANGQGIIDSDYYQPGPTDQGEGHIMFQLINLSPFPILLKRGETIGQGIIHQYLTTEDDNATGIRNGLGFGSTDQ